MKVKELVCENCKKIKWTIGLERNDDGNYTGSVFVKCVACGNVHLFVTEATIMLTDFDDDSVEFIELNDELN